MRRLAVAAAAGFLLAGCGGESSEITVTASSDEDRRIATGIEDELALYSEPFDISVLPTDQQDQLGPVYDAFPRAAGSVDGLVIEDGLVEARTGLPAEEESEITARLICGAVVRGAGRENAAGSSVTGENEAVLADCEPADANYP